MGGLGGGESWEVWEVVKLRKEGKKEEVCVAKYFFLSLSSSLEPKYIIFFREKTALFANYQITNYLSLAMSYVILQKSSPIEFSTSFPIQWKQRKTA